MAEIHQTAALRPLDYGLSPSLDPVRSHTGALRHQRSSVLLPCAKNLSFHAILSTTCRPLSCGACVIHSPSAIDMVAGRANDLGENSVAIEGDCEAREQNQSAGRSR